MNKTSKQRVLIFDDERTIRTVVGTTLTLHGYAVEEARLRAGTVQLEATA